jgi:GDPmannose 4,6-dehydratase
MKKALITGITGQDGSYLAELLLHKGYEVHGVIRRSSSSNMERIEHISIDSNDSSSRLFLHYGDISDSEQISNLMQKIRPDEIYNLAAQSHVRVSFDMPEYTGNVTGLGTTRLLEAARMCNPNVRIYQASSSEMFGSSPPPQNENTIFHPRSPYACAKLYSYWMTRIYREGYSLYVSNGILFNHESPRRGDNFVTRKITIGATDILSSKAKFLYLGNLDARRDWGFSPEYVEAMWIILQHKEPEDFVIGTGETHSIREFVDEVFSYVGLDPNEYVKIDQKYYRPTEVQTLIADASKANNLLKWKPKIKFSELAKIMTDADMRKAGLEPIGEGDEIIQKQFSEKWWNGD